MLPKRWRTVDDDDENEEEDDGLQYLNFDVDQFTKRDQGSSSHDGTNVIDYNDYKRVKPSSYTTNSGKQPMHPLARMPPAVPRNPMFPATPVAPFIPKSNREIENEQRVEIYKQSEQHLTPTRISELRQAAQINLDRHKANVVDDLIPIKFYVVAEDTLNAAQILTSMYHTRFAVLNMANAFTVGGGYLKGASAQEENLFRRTTIPTEIVENHRYAKDRTRYTQAASDVIEAKTGFVYIPKAPSVCFRGSEIHAKGNVQGYDFLPDDKVFDFWEIRSSAINTKSLKLDPKGYTVVNSMRMRIRAQLMTLISRDIKYVVLSAFGCGAFGNDAKIVATIYASELRLLLPHFRVIAFAIFYAGLNRENYDIFRNTMIEHFGNSVPVYDSFYGDVGDEQDDDDFDDVLLPGSVEQVVVN